MVDRYMYMLFDTEKQEYIETAHNISFRSISAAKNAYLATLPYSYEYRKTWGRCKGTVEVVRVKISEIKGEFVDN